MWKPSSLPLFYYFSRNKNTKWHKTPQIITFPIFLTCKENVWEAEEKETIIKKSEKLNTKNQLCNRKKNLNPSYSQLSQKNCAQNHKCALKNSRNWAQHIPLKLHTRKKLKFWRLGSPKSKTCVKQQTSLKEFGKRKVCVCTVAVLKEVCN